MYKDIYGGWMDARLSPIFFSFRPLSLSLLFGASKQTVVQYIQCLSEQPHYDFHKYMTTSTLSPVHISVLT